MLSKEKNVISHYGVLGMRWGVTRSRSSGGKASSDSKTVSSIRKKKLKDMTDDEIKTAMIRMRLIKEYKKARPPKGVRNEKKIYEMSNEELEKATRLRKLVKEDWFVGVRKMKDIGKMTDEEIKATLDRHFLEKEFRSR
jgi:indole-3-glycerol phosphate synthase